MDAFGSQHVIGMITSNRRKSAKIAGNLSRLPLLWGQWRWVSRRPFTQSQFVGSVAPFFGGRALGGCGWCDQALRKYLLDNEKISADNKII